MQILGIDTRNVFGPLRIMLAAATLATTVSVAAADYPERHITMIIPFVPGGSNDIIARLIQEPMRDALGQPIVIENRGGAGGNIGIGVAARSRPDGYTILLVSSVFAVNPNMYRNVPFDPEKDFVPVAELAYFPNIFVSHPQAGIADMSALIAKATQNTGGLNYSSSGIGTGGHLAVEILKLRSGIDIVHVPYSGAGPATQAVIAKTVDVGSMAISSALSYVRNDTLKALAVTGNDRWPGLPDVPTLQEAGVADAVTETWLGVFAPAGTPDAIVRRLGVVIKGIVDKPEIREKFQQAGFVARSRDQAVFQSYIAAEIAKWKSVIPQIGLEKR